MFYRYETSVETIERMRFKPQDKVFTLVFPKDRKQEELKATRYCYGKKEIGDWGACKLYQLPEVDEDYYSDMEFEKGKESAEIPDLFIKIIWIVVSQKVREIIEAIDDLPHQFVPMSFFDCMGNEIDKGPYYYMHIRRQVRFEPKDESQLQDDSRRQEYFQYIAKEQYLNTIQDSADLRDKFQKLPIWQHEIHRRNFYLNKELRDALNEQNIIWDRVREF